MGTRWVYSVYIYVQVEFKVHEINEKRSSNETNIVIQIWLVTQAGLSEPEIHFPL